MSYQDFAALLSGNPYPGRGILIGRTADNAKAVITYFIMGRSVNSRNRIFEATDDGIRTKAFDESKMTDPSLIIYPPVRVVGPVTIVTNGDQTDTIRDAMEAGHCYRHALKTRIFEPDGPNFTPRISGVLMGNGIPDGVGLVPVGDHKKPVGEEPHGMINNEGGVGHLALVKGLGADAVGRLLKDPVPGVDTAAHDEVDRHRPLSVGAAAQGNTPSGVGIFSKKFT